MHWAGTRLGLVYLIGTLNKEEIFPREQYAEPLPPKTGKIGFLVQKDEQCSETFVNAI